MRPVALLAFAVFALARTGAAQITQIPGATGGASAAAGVDRVWACSMNYAAIPGCALSAGTTNYPAANPVLGTNMLGGAVLTFPSGSATYAYGQFPVTGTVPASLTMEINWRTTDTTTAHTIIWNWFYACSSTSIDPSLSSAGSVTGNALSGSLQTQLSTITLASPSCTAGQFLFFYLAMRGDTATVTAGVDVNSVRIHS